ncbi:S-adenosyl-L-methionine-dependent methyltransferase [Aspergillus ambiguus]|uniref:S-adenosyl-L-methionine-dependent methyltransferase n=1 Tax=Aspergillus ambiguus TaxID=176160 RepID=UPI003CCE39A1
MATANSKTGTTYATTDWNKYQQGRPRYPPSLTKIICGYHNRHPSAKWERLIDIGGGSGIAAADFMAKFKTIHNSDPSPWNEEQARAFLSNYAEEHGLNPQLEYSQCTGEETWKHTGDSSADLVIVATAAHFMDPDGLVECAAKILRPGGTLAVYSYWNPSFPGRSQRFHEIFGKTFDRLVLQELESDDNGNNARLAKVVERRMTGGGCLDSVPLPAEFYDDTKRVYINAEPGDIPYKYLYQRFAAPGKDVGGVSRVDERDEIVQYKTDRDVEADGWSFETKKDWFPVFFNTIRPANSKRTEDELAEAYKEWEQAFDEECPNGTVQVQWPCYLVLARRKS